LPTGARRGGVKAMHEGRRARVLNRTDDGALLTAAARVARKAAGTARIDAAKSGRSSGRASPELAESDGSVVGGAGGAEVAVEELGGGDAVDAVVGSVTATST